MDFESDASTDFDKLTRWHSEGKVIRPRDRTRWIEEGKKPTKYFCNLEPWD